MQNDIVKRPTPPPAENRAAVPKQEVSPVVPSASPVVEQIAAPQPTATEQKVAIDPPKSNDGTKQTDDLQPEKAPAKKPPKTKSNSPIMICAIVVCFALIAVAVYAQMQ